MLHGTQKRAPARVNKWGDDAFERDHYEKMHEWFGEFSDDEFVAATKIIAM